MLNLVEHKQRAHEACEYKITQQTKNFTLICILVISHQIKILLKHAWIKMINAFNLSLQPMGKEHLT